MSYPEDPAAAWSVAHALLGFNKKFLNMGME